MTKKYILALAVIGIIATMIMAFGMVAAAEELQAPIVGATPPTSGISIFQADAGYYAETRTSTKVSGDIVFDACFADYEDYVTWNEDGTYDASRIGGYGFYIFNAGTGTSDVQNAKGSVNSRHQSDVNSLVDPTLLYDGFFNATVTNIKPEYFDSVVVAVPYVIIDGQLMTGTPYSFTVNQGGNKWLGPKN